MSLKLLGAAALCSLASAAHALPESLTFDGDCAGVTNIVKGDSGTVSADLNLTACGDTAYPSVGMGATHIKNLGKMSFFLTSWPIPGASSYLAMVLNEDGTYILEAPGYGPLVTGTWTMGYSVHVPASASRLFQSLRPH